MELRVSELVARPPSTVFRFVATDHVQNHPRWDPNMSLQQVTTGPIGVGTVIRRSYMRGDMPVEGEMEVVEFEPDRAMGVVIRDGPAEFRSRITMVADEAGDTLLTVTVEADVPDGRMDEAPIRASVRRIKDLIEAET